MSGAAAGRAGHAIGPWSDLSRVSLFPFFLRNDIFYLDSQLTRDRACKAHLLFYYVSFAHTP